LLWASTVASVWGGKTILRLLSKPECGRNQGSEGLIHGTPGSMPWGPRESHQAGVSGSFQFLTWSLALVGIKILE